MRGRSGRKPGKQLGTSGTTQVFDVPEVSVRVTAHLLHVLACAGCGPRSRATAPAGVTAPAVYGPMVTMLAAYLAAQHHIPVARITEILADLAGSRFPPAG